MEKINKINWLISSLGLFCIFATSLAAAGGTSTTNFNFNNASGYDVAVREYSPPANVTVKFSAPAPDHRIMRGTTSL